MTAFEFMRDAFFLLIGVSCIGLTVIVAVSVFNAVRNEIKKDD